MILLWGLAGDAPLAGVARRLSQIGAPAFLLDQRMVARTTVSLGASLSGTVMIDGVEVLALEDVTAAYIRPHDSTRIVERTAPSDPGALERAMQTDMALLAWADMAPGRILNRPGAMTSNDSKPYQADIIARHGLNVPDTLITTDVEAVRAFQARHGTLIYKSIGSTRSIVKRLGVEHSDRLDNLRWCPTQFQQHVPGTDFRVHVVDEHVFATEIRSQGDDYRYAALTGSGPELRAARLPDDVAARCCRVARALGLTFAGIDLRRTPAGEWYCFEANPSPGFSYYQQSTGQLIDLAVARLLAGDSHQAHGVRRRRARGDLNETRANSFRPDERRSHRPHAP
jgi:RimK-like ATP-grasp domain